MHWFSGFEPDLIPAAMLAHRIMGIMAHWREYMGKKMGYRSWVTWLTFYSKSWQVVSTNSSVYRWRRAEFGPQAEDLEVELIAKECLFFLMLLAVPSNENPWNISVIRNLSITRFLASIIGIENTYTWKVMRRSPYIGFTVDLTTKKTRVFNRHQAHKEFRQSFIWSST